MPLRIEVCAGTSDLIAAQQEIVVAWIAAMSRRLGSRRDLRRDDGSRLASARPPSGLGAVANVVGIQSDSVSGKLKLSDQAARSIG